MDALGEIVENKFNYKYLRLQISTLICYFNLTLINHLLLRLFYQLLGVGHHLFLLNSITRILFTYIRPFITLLCPLTYFSVFLIPSLLQYTFPSLILLTLYFPSLKYAQTITVCSLLLKIPTYYLSYLIYYFITYPPWHSNISTGKIMLFN